MIDYNATVLLVDDATCMQKIITHYLLVIGFKKVLTASDGGEALEVLKDNHSDIGLIISDINMPNMNGFTFLEEVKKSDEYREKVFIFISAECEKKTHERAEMLHADNFISKPFTLLSLGRTIYQTYEKIKEEDSLSIA